MRKDLPAPPSELKTDDEERADQIFHARIPIVLSPLVIAKEGRLKVRAHYSDGKILRLGSLKTRPLTSEEASALGIEIPAVPAPELRPVRQRTGCGNLWSHQAT
jgi:hypothetical protein